MAAGSSALTSPPATDPTAELQDLAGLGHLGEELGDLPAGEPLDEELHQRVVVVRGQGVGPGAV